MSVPSFQFLGFAVLFALIVNLSRHTLWRSLTMLAANLCFLLSFSHAPRALAPFALFIATSYLLLEVVRRKPKAMFWPAIILCLAAFFWLKKYAFVPTALFLRTPYVVVGISYITFRILHLIIDTAQGQIQRRIGLLDYLNYTLCFPCIVAGPIQMHPDYEAGHTGRPDVFAIGGALERIVIGMFKVFIISAALDALHTRATTYALAGEQPLVNAVAVVAGYAVYLYFNFSGYTDVVIGVGRLLGLKLPENFDRPFSSANFIEFWSRWHITLSTWLRTYVYTPFLMATMRRYPDPPMDTIFSVAAFFLTFFLVGAWHGQTAKFLFFGVLQGGGVAVNKLYQVLMAKALGRKPYRQLGAQPLYRALCRGLTFTWFAFTLLWFWSDWTTLGRLWAAIGPLDVLASLGLLWLGATLVLELLVRMSAATDQTPSLAAVRASPYARTVAVAAMVYVTVLAVYLLAAPAPSIVYKAF